MGYYKVIKTLEKHTFGNKFSVERQLIQLPDGRQTEFFIRSGQDYAIIIPVLDDNSLVMVEQPRLGMEEVSLEFPMGQVDGKTGTDIATIELKEETGYTADSLHHLATLRPSSGWSLQNAQVYVATGLTAGAQELEPFENITVKIVTVDELKKLISTGKMIDMPTITAFYLYLEYLSKTP